MNIQQIADRLADRHEMPRARAKQLVDAILGSIADAVANGEVVSLPGFGKFKVADRPARAGRNPATGERIEIAASRKLTFTAAKQLKDKLLVSKTT